MDGRSPADPSASEAELADGVDTVDAVVLGLGPGGNAVAHRLLEAGWSVAGVERGLVGGECAYWGCVPSKMMLRAAHLLGEARRIPELAGAVETRPDWRMVARRIREVGVDDWDDRSAVEAFVEKGGRFVRGNGRLRSSELVEVTADESGSPSTILRAERALVIATGAAPVIPPIEGLNDVPYWTNHDVVQAEEVPESMIVLGAGPIGAELAQVFARFGCRVTVLEAADHLLPGEHPDVGAALAEAFAADDIDVRTDVEATQVEHVDDRFRVRLAGGDTVQAQRLLIAAGRRVDLDAIGAGVLGIDTAADSLPVDGHLRVSDGVWAVGDVTGCGAFTHVATNQARIVAHDILGEACRPFAAHAVPRVTFTDPEVAAVGMSGHDARSAGLEVTVARAEVPESARGWIHGAGNTGFVEVIVDRSSDTLVGATVVGPHAGEVIGLLTLAVHDQVGVETMRSMIYAYPTFHRAVEDALDRLS